MTSWIMYFSEFTATSGSSQIVKNQFTSKCDVKSVFENKQTLFIGTIFIISAGFANFGVCFLIRYTYCMFTNAKMSLIFIHIVAIKKNVANNSLSQRLFLPK